MQAIADIESAPIGMSIGIYDVRLAGAPYRDGVYVGTKVRDIPHIRSQDIWGLKLGRCSGSLPGCANRMWLVGDDVIVRLDAISAERAAAKAAQRPVLSDDGPNETQRWMDEMERLES